MIRSRSTLDNVNTSQLVMKNIQVDDTSKKAPANSKGVSCADSPRDRYRFLSGSKHWNYLLFIIVIGIVIYVTIIVFDESLSFGSNNKVLYEKKGQVTAMINTFKRPDMMEDAIKFYSSCDLIGRIYVIWSESNELPKWVVNKYGNTQSKVVFLPHDTKSLNNRFLPLGPSHRRTDAIFSTDDDMRVGCADLERAYTVWRGSPRSLVGYMPRIHLRDSSGVLQYRCWWRVWWHGSYSIILTKAALLHHDYLELYSQQMPASIRALVDSERNCEDIAMQFLIANTSHLPPIYVKGHLADLGAFNGISTDSNVLRAEHMDKRSQCLNALVKEYGSNPLVLSHIIVDAASNWWTNAPSTWLEYISSDLWKL